MSDPSTIDTAYAQKQDLDSLQRLAVWVSHAIRNPLAIMRMGIDNVDRYMTEKPELAGEFLADIEQAIARAEHVMSDLFQFGSPAPLNPVLIPVRDLLEEARKSVENKLEAKSIQFRCTVDPATLEIEVDRTRLVNVLQQLILNGIEAVPPQGELTIKAHTSLSEDITTEARKALVCQGYREGEVLVIEVSDTGPGVPDELLPRLFEPFFTTRMQQLGLGLSIARSDVEAHQGTITADNLPETGSLFRIYLPVETNA